MRHLLRVALVHLAAIRLNEKFWHGRTKIIHGRAAFAPLIVFDLATRGDPSYLGSNNS